MLAGLTPSLGNTAAREPELLRMLALEVEPAVVDGDLVPDADPRALAFELNALAVGTNQAVQLFGDAGAPARGRALMHRAILSRAGRSDG
jgi:hypothetical protein